jgi:hypothetical protein
MGTTSVPCFCADTGGNASADDAKVRAKATAISRSIGSLPFVLMSWPSQPRGSGRAYGIKDLHRFGDTAKLSIAASILLFKQTCHSSIVLSAIENIAEVRLLKSLGGGFGM